MDPKNLKPQNSTTELEELDPKFCNIFVGGLGRKFNEETILAYFKKKCHVEKYVVKMRGTQKEENFPVGYLILTTLKSDSSKLLRNPYHKIGEKKVECKPYLRGKDLLEFEIDFNSRRLKVDNLPKRISDEEFHEKFQIYGSLLNSYIVIDYKTNQSTGVGFLLFDQESTVKALLELKEVKFKGRILEVGRTKKYEMLLNRLKKLEKAEGSVKSKRRKRGGKEMKLVRGSRKMEGFSSALGSSQRDGEIEGMISREAEIGTFNSKKVRWRKAPKKKMFHSEMGSIASSALQEVNHPKSSWSTANLREDQYFNPNKKAAMNPLLHPRKHSNRTNWQKAPDFKPEFPQIASLIPEVNHSYQEATKVDQTQEMNISYWNSLRLDTYSSRQIERVKFLMKQKLCPDFHQPRASTQRLQWYRRGSRLFEPDAFHSFNSRLFLKRVGTETEYYHGDLNIRLNKSRIKGRRKEINHKSR